MTDGNAGTDLPNTIEKVDVSSNLEGANASSKKSFFDGTYFLSDSKGAFRSKAKAVEHQLFSCSVILARCGAYSLMRLLLCLILS